MEFTDKQRDFVLGQYVRQGVDELDAEKLAPLLKLKYKNALSDASAELGRPEQVSTCCSILGDEVPEFRKPFCLRQSRAPSL
jgi:hypothetical protein